MSGEVTYLQAISRALADAMEADGRVFCLGEDIGAYGGAFKVTKGFLERFGPQRVLDTPVAESAILGVAVGAALMGMRPVAEMQFADFVACGFNQLVNVAAKSHYRWGASVPMTVRLPYGAGGRGGPFHSQSMEAWFFHVPGLKIVAPATVPDAYGLLRSAIQDENPVLYFEHKYLYRRVKGRLAEVPESVPLGKARIARSGRDAVIVTYGATLHTALEAAETVATESGAQVEVLDLRSLAPWDREAVLEAVGRCHRVLVLHEANRTGGVGAEVAAEIAQAAFENLDAPVVRVAAPDLPIPFSPPLEDAYLPGRERVVAALRELLEY
jgi:2-oxoisovalerate dehydrogenase E1 component beta subunit